MMNTPGAYKNHEPSTVVTILMEDENQQYPLYSPPPPIPPPSSHLPCWHIRILCRLSMIFFVFCCLILLLFFIVVVIGVVCFENTRGQKVRDKMLYSSSKQDVRQGLGLGFFEGEYYASVRGDLTFESLLSSRQSGRGDQLLSEAE